MKVLLSPTQLQDGIQQMADQISQHYQGRAITVVGILTGSLMLLADLIRMLDQPIRISLVEASSYRGTTTRGKLTINPDLLSDIEGRDILLIDDIFDTGYTLQKVIRMIEDLQPNSVRSAVLLLKEGRQEVELRPDFVGFQIPDQFVVGYGLDYQDLFRNLPYVATLEPEDLSGEAE